MESASSTIERGLASAVARVAGCDHLLVASDFDGTLAPLVDDPARARALPAAEIPAFTQERAMALVAMPLACLDRPHAVPEQRTEYLWTHDSKPHILDTYTATRAFYGC